MTWNINSLRLRMGLLAELVEATRPDIVCLQETKVMDPDFPAEDCRSLGFPHIAFSGIKSYNGVAVLSRRPLGDIRIPQRCERADARHLAVRVEGIDLHCLYVPAGGDIPDPEANPKFAHKLAFLDDIAAWCGHHVDADAPAMIVGDFNVAPLETDVWSHRQMLGVVSHTPVEVAGLAGFQRSAQWLDAVRHFIPPSERLYTWWSYRSSDWTKNDRGRRLDHIWVTPALADRLSGAMVLREVRGWGKPSDHVPVILDLTEAV